MATGTVKKRGKSWEIAVNMGYVDGKRKRKRWISKARTKAEATLEMNAELYKFNRQARPGGAIDNNYEIEDLANQWLESLEHSVSISDKTRLGYAPIIRKTIKALNEIEVVKVSDLDNDTAEKMLSVLIKEASHNTANKCLAKLKAVLNYGIDKSIITSNPINRKRSLPAKKVKERRALTHEEAAGLLKVSEGTQHHLFWLWLLSTGMRLSEALHARWEWIDWDNKTVTLEDDTRDGWDPKTEAGHRRIPLPPELFKLLQQEKSSTGYIFFNDSTQVRDNLRSARLKQFKTHMRRVLADAKVIKLSRSTSQSDRDWLEKELKKVDIHSLRYTYITELISKNADPKTVQYLAGHADVTTTLGIYAQYREGNTVEIAQMISWINKDQQQQSTNSPH